MSNTPVDRPKTTDTWVAQLQQKGFQPDEEGTALSLVGITDKLFPLFADVKTFKNTSGLPVYVAIMEQRIPAAIVNKNGGEDIPLPPGSFTVVYCAPSEHYLQGCFDERGEPLEAQGESQGREIKQKLFD